MLSINRGLLTGTLLGGIFCGGLFVASAWAASAWEPWDSTWSSWDSSSPSPEDYRLQLLATVTNDHDPAVSRLSAALDAQNRAIGIDFLTNNHDGDPPTIDHKFFTVAQIAADEGVVLHRQGSHNIFILQGLIDVERGRGDLLLYYLANGLWGRYDSCRITAIRSAQGSWSLQNAYNGRPITEIRAITWTFGISTVENVCPAE